MASDQTVLDALGSALWDARPTGSCDVKAQQLAWALGYPPTWRVVRSMEEIPTNLTNNKNKNNNTKQEDLKHPEDKQVKQEEEETNIEEKDTRTKEEEEECVKKEDENMMEKEETTQKKEKEVKEEKPAPQFGQVVREEKDTKKINQKRPRTCIVDRIYAGKPGSGCDMWFHHSAAMAACAEGWNEDPFGHKGGHLLPRQALFDKGDKVQVLFNDEWFNAKVLKRKQQPDGSFRYQVFYSVDKSRQNGIPEERIREQPLTFNKGGSEDASQMAKQLGFKEDGWQAVTTGHNRWKITSPSGEVYNSKKQAMAAYTTAENDSSNKADEGDPPWRTTDHEYLGRWVKWSQQHAVSARRTITVEQMGQVTGWIAAMDVDKAGKPGFVSEKTGKPSALFHVVFEDSPAHLQKYFSYLVASQDLELEELENCLIAPEDVPRNTKKLKKGK